MYVNYFLSTLSTSHKLIFPDLFPHASCTRFSSHIHFQVVNKARMLTVFTSACQLHSRLRYMRVMKVHETNEEVVSILYKTSMCMSYQPDIQDRHVHVTKETGDG